MKLLQYLLFVISIICGFFFGCQLIEHIPFKKYEGWKRGEHEAFIIDEKTYSKIHDGDTKTYQLVVDSINMLTPEHPNYLGLALIMANEYDYAPANYDVYLCLKNLYKFNGLGEFDKRTKALAMEYFQRALEMGDKRATKEIEVNDSEVLEQESREQGI